VASLRARLLLAASLVLLVFIALCGAGLEKAFRDSALAAQEQRMQGLVYALLGAAEQEENGQLGMRGDTLPEPRLEQPQSGLEAALFDEAGALLWRSPGAADRLPLIVGPEIGAWQFERIGEAGLFALSFGLRWIGDDGLPQRYTIVVFESPVAYEEQLGIFRRTLWQWLLAAAAGLLAVLLLILRWGLHPLRRLAGELHGVETGRQTDIESRYPEEITPLAGALNAMIRSERNRQKRYRDALGDLAHSLKTPLAVLKGLQVSMPEPELQRQFDEQLGRMQQIVDHQLSRAAAAGPRTLVQKIAIKPVADKLAEALAKVYGGRRLRFQCEIDAALSARVDAGDLYELLGNPMDNAAKWARTVIRVRTRRESDALVVEIEDDGPGFPDETGHLLERGVRADSRHPGQGLGLAATAGIIEVYEGSIQLARSGDLGGARVCMRIPG
jgi:two-component system, OmpR family, sensor histidine kinase PhoQ